MNPGRNKIWEDLPTGFPMRVLLWTTEYSGEDSGRVRLTAYSGEDSSLRGWRTGYSVDADILG